MNVVTFKPSETYKTEADRIFLQERNRIKKALPQVIVEHVGSTIIPQALTKGDLDINVRVDKKDFNYATQNS